MLINKSSIKAIEIFADGGCRRNGMDGAHAYGSFTVMVNGKVVHQETNDYVDCLQTNNVAEYKALIDALSYMKADAKRAALEFTIKTDSELVLTQLNGSAKVKKDHLKPLHAQACALLQGLQCAVVHVDRAQIVAVLGH